MLARARIAVGAVKAGEHDGVRQVSRRAVHQGRNRKLAQLGDHIGKAHGLFREGDRAGLHRALLDGQGAHARQAGVAFREGLFDEGLLGRDLRLERGKFVGFLPQQAEDRTLARKARELTGGLLLAQVIEGLPHAGDVAGQRLG